MAVSEHRDGVSAGAKCLEKLAVKFDDFLHPVLAIEPGWGPTAHSRPVGSRHEVADLHPRAVDCARPVENLRVRLCEEHSPTRFDALTLLVELPGNVRWAGET